MPKKTILIGVGGKAAHVFYTCYRPRAEFRVLAFLDRQTSSLSLYPPELAGPLYPQGIPVLPFGQLRDLAWHQEADEVVFADCETSFEELSRLEQMVVFEAGSEFQLAQVERCLLPAGKPAIAVCGASSGCGKTTVALWVADKLRAGGKRLSIGRYPVGDMLRHPCCRLTSLAHTQTLPSAVDSETADAVYSGVDWSAIWEQAAAEADVLLWDGGHNDLPFVKPDLYITVVDATRTGSESSYPGYINIEMADVLVVNRQSELPPERQSALQSRLRHINPTAPIWAWHEIAQAGSEASQQLQHLLLGFIPTV